MSDLRRRKKIDAALARALQGAREYMIREGIRGAPGPWMAGKLGVTRQAISVWGRDGIPDKWVGPIATVARIKPSELRPAPLPIDLPADILDEVIVVSRKLRRSLAETIVELVRIGLKRASKTRHG